METKNWPTPGKEEPECLVSSGSLSFFWSTPLFSCCFFCCGHRLVLILLVCLCSPCCERRWISRKYLMKRNFSCARSTFTVSVVCLPEKWQLYWQLMLILTVGFAFLPFLWLVNFIWFFKYAFGSSNSLLNESGTSHSPIKHQLKRYVILSGAGSLVWAVGLSVWNIYFQTNRASLSWGDDLSFILPIGRPWLLFLKLFDGWTCK